MEPLIFEKTEEQRFDCMTGMPTYKWVTYRLKENEQVVAVLVGDDEMAAKRARLLAAAPEMLSAIQYALEHFKTLNVPGVSTIISDMNAIMTKVGGLS
jgi:hypothetical protein